MRFSATYLYCPGECIIHSGKRIVPLENTSNRLWKIPFWQRAVVGYILPRNMGKIRCGDRCRSIRKKRVCQISYTRNTQNFIELGQYIPRRAKVKNVCKKNSKNLKNSRKKNWKWGLVNQLYKVYTKFYRARSITATPRWAKEKILIKKNELCQLQQPPGEQRL